MQVFKYGEASAWHAARRKAGRLVPPPPHTHTPKPTNHQPKPSPKVGVGHLSGAVDDAAHDGDGHARQVAGALPDLVGHLLQVCKGEKVL